MAETAFGRIFTRSASMLEVLERLRHLAESELTITLEGETGTGKELAAEAVHQASARRDGPFVVIDCAAIPPDLVGSELFGHARGAFTSAEIDRAGAFETASGGTVFIDEIGELPLELQGRLLGVLERRQVRRLGENQVRAVDVRVLAATNRRLEDEVAAGRFRKDLYYRMSVAMVRLPPLRERIEDVPLLIERFLDMYPTASGTRAELRPEDLPRVTAYAWPGNVRELRNVIARGASIADRYVRLPPELFAKKKRDSDASSSQEITTPVAIAPPGGFTAPLWRGRSYKDARDAIMEDFERGYAADLLREHAGNVSAAAKAAGIHRNVLTRMLARHGIDRTSRVPAKAGSRSTGAR